MRTAGDERITVTARIRAASAVEALTATEQAVAAKGGMVLAFLGVEPIMSDQGGAHEKARSTARSGVRRV